MQEQFDFFVLEAFDLNLVSLGRNVALEAFDMFSKKVSSRSNFSRQSCEVHRLLLFFLSSNRF